MKTKAALTMVLVAALAGGVNGQILPDEPQMDTAKDLASALEGMARLGDQVLAAQANGYGFIDDDWAIYGKHLSAREHADVTLDFPAGKRVRVLAAGNEAALDVDLRLYSQTDRELMKDTDEARDASMSFTTQAAGKLRIRLALYKEQRQGIPAFCALAVMVKDGHQVSKVELGRLLAKQTRNNTACAALAQLTGGNLRYQRSPDSWSVMGTVLNHGGQQKSWIPSLEQGRMLFNGVADSKALDIDLAVTDPAGKKHEDQDEDAEPMVELVVGGPGQHAMVPSAPNTMGKTLSLVSILHY